LNISEHKLLHTIKIDPTPGLDFTVTGCGDVAKIKVFTDISSTYAEWTTFETTAIHTVFQTYSWLSTWQEHIGSKTGTQPQIIIGYGRDGTPCFILPLAFKKFGPLRILCYLGCEEASYQIGLYAPKFATSLTQENAIELHHKILAILPKFHVARFKRQPFEWQGVKNPFAYFTHKTAPSSSYAITLNADYQALYAATRSGKSRSKILRRERRLAEHGKIQIKPCVSDAETTRVLDIMFAQKEKRFCEQGISNFLKKPGVQDFYRSLCLNTNSKGTRTLGLHYYQCGDQVLAAVLSAPYGTTEFGLINSMSDGPLRNSSPGLHLLHRDIERLCLQGTQIYDLGVGSHSYKDLWTDKEHSLFDTIIPMNLMGYVYAYGSRIILRTKRNIKNSKILWPAFVKFRARLFSIIITDKCPTVDETI